MAKKEMTKREKRLKQLMTLIVFAIVSCILNFVLIGTGVYYHLKITNLNESVTSLKQSYDEYVEKSESLISQLTYEQENEVNQDKNEQTLENEEQKEDNKEPIIYDTGKKAYLTFDDGPSDITSGILDVLKEHDVKATFFIKGVSIKYHPDYLNRIVDEGHTIGNHTVTHKYESIYTSLETLTQEIKENNRRILEQTGVVPVAFRFPGGSSNSMFEKYSDVPLNDWLNLINDLGMEYYDWNVSSLDASGKKLSADEIYNAVIKGCEGKEQVTILMHDVNPNTSTLEALPRIIEILKELGYSIEPITTNTKPVQHRVAE